VIGEVEKRKVVSDFDVRIYNIAKELPIAPCRKVR
jgi:hypothetical protein